MHYFLFLLSIFLGLRRWDGTFWNHYFIFHTHFSSHAALLHFHSLNSLNSISYARSRAVPYMMSSVYMFINWTSFKIPPLLRPGLALQNSGLRRLLSTISAHLVKAWLKRNMEGNNLNSCGAGNTCEIFTLLQIVRTTGIPWEKWIEVPQ